MNRLLLATAATAVLSAAPAASAQSFLEVVNPTALRTTTASTQFVGAGVDLVVGQLRLRLDEGQRAFVTYTLEGAETTLRNQFFGPGESSMIDSTAARGTLITTSLAAGLLDFSFRSSGKSAVVSNAANYGWSTSQFGLVLDPGRLSGRLLFEDGWPRTDLDFDDLVVRFNVSVAPVPEPGAIALMLAGLGVVAVATRRRRRPV